MSPDFSLEKSAVYGNIGVTAALFFVKKSETDHPRHITPFKCKRSTSGSVADS